MTHFSPQTLQIGMIGHTTLLCQNVIRFRQMQERHQLYHDFQVITIPVYHKMQIAQLDGLLITGWQQQMLYHQIVPLQTAILNHLESLALWGIASGASMLGRNGIIPAIDCTITSHACPAISTSILEFPGCTPERFVGYFIPDIRFSAPAPNLGILCQNESHGIVAVRQGNYLASSFAAELTPALSLYQYWLEMVASLKEWQI